MKKIFVSPSILSSDFSKLGEECKSLEKCGADWIHCDVMDGMFVPNITIGMGVVQSIRKCVVLPLDVHLMVVEPERYVVRFAECGADIITVHVEASNKIEEIASVVHSMGKKFGLSVKPNTPVSELEKYRGIFDMILIMTVEPGFGGQVLINSCIDKVKQARELFPDTLIEVDGGVNFENAQTLVDAGANILVTGSTVFNAPNRAEAITKLHNCK